MIKWMRALIKEMSGYIEEEPTTGLIYVTPVAFVIVFGIITIAHFV